MTHLKGEETLGQPLTPREMDVLSLRASGLTSQATSEALFISKRTVDFHCNHAFRKLGARNLLQAIKAAPVLLDREAVLKKYPFTPRKPYGKEISGKEAAE